MARRLLLGVAVLALGAAGLVALVLFFSGRDDAAVNTVEGPGQLLPDRGARHIQAGERGSARPTPVPPVSGPHVPVAVRRDETTLSDDQILHALELGDVVLVYGTAEAPRALRALAARSAGRFDPALAQAGQAVILARRPGVRGVLALAWRRLLRASSPADGRLSAFVEAWLGRGAPR